MLARMNKLWLGPVGRFERVVERCDFHEIWASGGDQVDLDHVGFR